MPVPRQQGYPLRHGPERGARQQPRPTRPLVADQCLRRRLAEPSWGRRGVARLPPSSQVQHHQATHALAAPAGDHALPTHPNHAGAPPAATDRAVRQHAEGSTCLRHDVWCNLRMREVLSQISSSDFSLIETALIDSTTGRRTEARRAQLSKSATQDNEGRLNNERSAGLLNRTQYPSDVIALVKR